jgi:hypothetical protein
MYQTIQITFEMSNLKREKICLATHDTILSSNFVKVELGQNSIAPLCNKKKSTAIQSKCAKGLPHSYHTTYSQI